MVLREDRQPLAPTMPQSDSPTVRRVSTSSPAAALSRRLGSFKQTYPPASEMSLPLIGAQIERTSSDRPDEIDSASDRASERPISPTQVPLDMLPSSTPGFLAPRPSSGKALQPLVVRPLELKKSGTAAGPSGSRGRASGGERKEPDSSGVEMHDVAAAASAGTVHGAAPAPSPAETLVDLSDDVPAAPFENQYHHNAARQDKIAMPTEREMQQLLTKVGTAATCTALREGAAERISLNVRGLTDADCVSLGHLLKVPNRLSALTTLSLSNNAIGDLGARALGDALASPGGAPLLTRLALHENAIGDDGLAALAASFTPSGAPKLQHLRLSFNRIGDAGLHALSSALAAGGARELRELHLAANNIGDAGATAIAEQLHHVPKLTTLVYGTSVGGNHIAGPGVSALVRALRANGGRPLSTSLRSNPLTTHAMGEIQQLIRDGGVDLLHFQYDAPTTGAPAARRGAQTVAAAAPTAAPTPAPYGSNAPDDISFRVSSTVRNVAASL